MHSQGAIRIVLPGFFVTAMLLLNMLGYGTIALASVVAGSSVVTTRARRELAIFAVIRIANHDP
jgi:hypothetical protein